MGDRRGMDGWEHQTEGVGLPKAPPVGSGLSPDEIIFLFPTVNGEEHVLFGTTSLSH